MQKVFTFQSPKWVYILFIIGMASFFREVNSRFQIFKFSIIICSYTFFNLIFIVSIYTQGRTKKSMETLYCSFT